MEHSVRFWFSLHAEIGKFPHILSKAIHIIDSLVQSLFSVRLKLLYYRLLKFGRILASGSYGSEMTLTISSSGLYFDGYVISQLYYICELFNRDIVERLFFDANTCVNGDGMSSYLSEYKALPSTKRVIQHILSTVFRSADSRRQDREER